MSLNLEKSIYSIIDRADCLIFYSDPKYKILMCNKKFEETMDMPKDMIVGSDCLKLIYRRLSSIATKEQIFKAVIDNVMRHKRPGNFEGIFPDRNGSKRIIRWNISPMLTQAKELEGILFLGNDITSSKEREATFKNIDDTLKNIFLSVKEYALYTTNLDGNITYYGMGSENMFGWKRNEIILKHISFLHPYDDIAQKLPFIFEQVRNLGRYELETYFIRNGGESFPVNLTITKFMDTNGNMIGYVFMAKDITERRKLEHQIFQSEKLAALGQLIAGIAHEINNPVFVISGRADMILASKPLSKKIKNDLKIIATQIDRIRKLVDRFLMFARKKSPSNEELDINIVIRGVLPLLAYHKLPSHNIKLVKLLAKGLPKIKGDAHQLQEVFVNLLINAYQAMPEGGLLTIKTKNLFNEFAQITINDTGCGIGPENLRNIFMPFFSTKKDGTGLGLSICFNIIKNHNGTIEIESQVGKGTTFTIKLPFILRGLKTALFGSTAPIRLTSFAQGCPERSRRTLTIPSNHPERSRGIARAGPIKKKG